MSPWLYPDAKTHQGATHWPPTIKQSNEIKKEAEKEAKGKKFRE